MATMTITIPDPMLPRVVDALCASAGLTGADVTAANAKLQVVAYMKQVVKDYEAALSEATNDIDVT